MYDIEKAKQYAWEQADWIAHSNGYFLMKDCVFFYHKGNVVFDPWNDVDGNAVDDPFSFYGKDKMDAGAHIRICAEPSDLMARMGIC